jgi:hypothetical protein
MLAAINVGYHHISHNYFIYNILRSWFLLDKM